MDILYVIGKGSKHDNEELRYSLRSISQNGLNVGRVFIAGYPPEFVNTKYITIVPCGDIYNHKHKNILHCIETAIKKTDIGGECGDFLLSSDDHFYTQKVDFDNYPYFCKGQLPKQLNGDKEKNVAYRLSLVETREMLEKYGLTTHNFSWHGNTHFNAKFFIDNILALAHESYEDTLYGVEPTCLMLNAMLREVNFPITFREDVKIADFQSRNDLQQSTKDRECISVYDSGYEKGVRRLLKEMFPNKCRYEV